LSTGAAKIGTSNDSNDFKYQSSWIDQGGRLDQFSNVIIFKIQDKQQWMKKNQPKPTKKKTKKTKKTKKKKSP
jgi:hypothetical protein